MSWRFAGPHKRSSKRMGAALAAGALLAAASSAHGDVSSRPAGVPGPRTLNPQPEPPGFLHDARAAVSLTIDGVEGAAGGARKSAALVMYAANGTAVARYHLESAWPAKIEIGGLRAGASEVLIETVTVASDDIQRLDA